MNIDFRSIVYFLHRKGLTGKQIQFEIDSVLGANSYSYSAITKSLRELSFYGPKENTIKKEQQYVREERFDAILKTLRDFPFSSLKQIEERTGIPKTSVERLLTLNGFVSRHLKWIPHNLNSSQKVSRINQSKRLLKILQAARQNNYRSLITGDESWFYLSTDHKTQWVAPGEKPAKRAKKMIGSKKYMLTIFWNPNGFHLVKFLPDNTKFNATYFINEILDPLYEITTDIREDTGETIILHYDNARPHTSRKVLEFLESHDMEKAPQPAFSPDLAPSDFYLFGHLKDMLAGSSFESPEELCSKVVDILEGISEKELMDAFLTWERRLMTVISNGGDYVE